MKWHQWSLRRRILMGFALVLTPGVVLVVVLLLRLQAINADLERLNQALATETRVGTEIVHEVAAVQQAIDRYLQAPSGQSLGVAQAALTRLDVTIAAQRALLGEAGQQLRLDAIAGDVDPYQRTFAELSTLIEQRRATAVHLNDQLFLANVAVQQALGEVVEAPQPDTELRTLLLKALQSLQLAHVWSTRLLSGQSLAAADNALIQLDALRAYIQVASITAAPALRTTLMPVEARANETQQAVMQFTRESIQIQTLSTTLLDQQGVHLAAQAQGFSVEAQRQITALTVDLKRQSAEVLQSAGIALLATLALAVFLALQLTETITRPVRDLVTTSDLLRRNRFPGLTAQVEIGEVGRLAQAFDELVLVVKRQHQQLIDHQALLEARVAERTAELAKAQQVLYKNQKLEAIGRLAGGIAHDFNNVLTVIQGSCDLLSDDLAHESPARAEVNQIRQATRHATALVRQILAFSRQQTLRPRHLNLSDVVAQVEPLLRRAAGAKVQLIISLPKQGTYVYADEAQLEQVIMNLVINAGDAMPDGGAIEIRVAQQRVLDGDRPQQPILRSDRWVMMSVSDTGIGMEEATVARIFDPFFTTKGEGKGTGLGLSTVHGIVMQSGGQIEVQSRLGYGTTFTILLPYAAGDDSDQWQ
jgi:signal transduction histidine kinase